MIHAIARDTLVPAVLVMPALVEGHMLVPVVPHMMVPAVLVMPALVVKHMMVPVVPHMMAREALNTEALVVKHMMVPVVPHMMVLVDLVIQGPVVPVTLALVVRVNAAQKFANKNNIPVHLQDVLYEIYHCKNNQP
jgi:hypothetical protein